MKTEQLRCFIAAADTLHFGRAAQNLNMLPAAFGRQIKLLEQSLGLVLFNRSTRSVELTLIGQQFYFDACHLIDQIDAVENRYKNLRIGSPLTLRVGAIDSAAIGLLPKLILKYKRSHSNVSIRIIEDKTKRLIPKLLSGAIDLALIRPPDSLSERIEIEPICHESLRLALPDSHPLATLDRVTIDLIADFPMIVPNRKDRPHSYDLTFKLFQAAGFQPRISQVANEKQTILNLVAQEMGLAIVPSWSTGVAPSNVCFREIEGHSHIGLPLAAAWLKGCSDSVRQGLVEMLKHSPELIDQ